MLIEGLRTWLEKDMAGNGHGWKGTWLEKGHGWKRAWVNQNIYLMLKKTVKSRNSGSELILIALNLR